MMPHGWSAIFIPFGLSVGTLFSHFARLLVVQYWLRMHILRLAAIKTVQEPEIMAIELSCHQYDSSIAMNEVLQESSELCCGYRPSWAGTRVKPPQFTQGITPSKNFQS